MIKSSLKCPLRVNSSSDRWFLIYRTPDDEDKFVGLATHGNLISPGVLNVLGVKMPRKLASSVNVALLSSS